LVRSGRGGKSPRGGGGNKRNSLPARVLKKTYQEQMCCTYDGRKKPQFEKEEERRKRVSRCRGESQPEDSIFSAAKQRKATFEKRRETFFLLRNGFLPSLRGYVKRLAKFIDVKRKHPATAKLEKEIPKSFIFKPSRKGGCATF